MEFSAIDYESLYDLEFVNGTLKKGPMRREDEGTHSFKLNMDKNILYNCWVPGLVP